MTRPGSRLAIAGAVLGMLAALLAIAPSAGGQAPADTCFGLEVTILGTDEGETIRGTPGDDIIQAGAGDDTVLAGPGDDVVCGGPGADTIRGGTGEDALFGQGGPDSIFGGRDDDLADGGGGGDLLVGQAGDDNLVGRRGTDSVLGGAGDDTLRGGPAWDDCRPGRGADTRIRCEATVFAVADGPLGGASLESGPARAIRRMNNVFGPPTDDTGWVVGCPLDSETDRNERVLSWGSLSASFYGSPGNRTFQSWGYRPFDGPAPRGPGLDDVVLPGGWRVGDPLQNVADALGVEPIDNPFDLSLIVRAPGGGLDVFGGSGLDPTGPITSVEVGDYLVCD